MIFVKTEKAENVALSTIRSYAYMQSGKVRIIDAEGESHLVDGGTFDTTLYSALLTAVPAAPNTYLLTPVSHDDGRRTWDRDVVVAWGIRADGGVTAIGAEGADNDNRAVLMPNGSVQGSFATWNSFEDYATSQSEG